jgi:hypothetical protein
MQLSGGRLAAAPRTARRPAPASCPSRVSRLHSEKYFPPSEELPTVEPIGELLVVVPSGAHMCLRSRGRAELLFS